jgi:hypothetical protein
LRSQSVDCGKDGPHHRTGDRDFGQLEGDGAGVAHDASADHDQLELEAGQRPISHGGGQLRLAYLAPEVLKRLVYGREGPAVTVLDLSDCAALPWAEQAGVAFEAEGQRSM